MGVPKQVQYIFTAFDSRGRVMHHVTGFSDDYTEDLKRFQAECYKHGAVRIAADLALPDE